MLAVRLMLLSSVIFWGWSFVATKVVLHYMAPVEIIGLRLLLGLPILGLIILKRGVRFQYSRREWGVVVAASIVLIAHFIIQITGLIDTSATNTGWIISVTPAVIAVLSFFILKERLNRLQVVGVVTATVGIIALVSKGDFSSVEWLSSKGDWLVLASAFTWAIYTVLTRDISRRHRPLGVSFILMLFTALPIWVWMIFTSDFSKFAHLPAEPIWALLFLGIVCLGLAFWFWQEGISKLGAAKAGFFLYLEPLATTALAVPYLGEEFGFFAALGGALVLIGVYLAERKTAQR